MKKLSFVVVLFMFIKGISFAQDQFDALRYGYNQYYGTARSMSVGNAMGSIGGDFTSLSINPAGIGIYRRGEIAFSPSYVTTTNTGTYLGESERANSSKLNFSHAGIVLTHSRKGNAYKKGAWKAASFAFGMNRTANYKNEYRYTGKNYSNSLIERYAEEFNALGGINALNIVSYPAYAAYQTWLIDRGFGADSNNAFSYVPFADGIRQNKKVTESGSMQEYVISGGGNYMEKLMLGATLAIPYVTYNRTLMFDEVDISGKDNNDFKYMNFSEQLKTTGTGINLKLGVIYKPTDIFRVGLAFHTPTYIQFNDISSISMQSHTDSLLLYNNPLNSPLSSYVQDTALVFNYAQTTPYKAIVSASVLFGQYGFLTADAEYVDYSGMKYNYGQGYEFESNAVNTLITNTYKSAVNFRVGAEAKWDQLCFRAGAAYYGSPYRNSQYDASRLNLSGGLGFRGKSWFIDLAYVRSMQKYLELPYMLQRANADVKTAEIKSNANNMVMTLGWKFR